MKQEQNNSSIEEYKIVLPQFEGPFDLLLFFIERDELDIYDIPIAQITDNFLNYIHQLNQLNIEVASEFILVAATLMKIKSKTLIPRKELDEDGNEIDPREELVQRLLEYKKYKEVIEQLREMEADRLLKNKRGGSGKEMQKIAELFSTEAELENLELYQLLKAFKRVMNKLHERESKPVHTVVKYNYTIRNQKNYLLEAVAKQPKLAFEDAFLQLENRVQAVFTFLAMLELIQEKFLKISSGVGINNFWLSKG
ncbi:MAG: segregation/condensation protein A [Chitinophagales bacterium]|nr:segregation/condensation protein A [Bacteroidota bacterium]MCB9225728.1 segregation/condensation protein A [Chitinophagales bacterium]